MCDIDIEVNVMLFQMSYSQHVSNHVMQRNQTECTLSRFLLQVNPVV